MSPILLQMQTDTKKKICPSLAEKVLPYLLTTILAFLRQIRPLNHEMSSESEDIGSSDGMGFVCFLSCVVVTESSKACPPHVPVLQLNLSNFPHLWQVEIVQACALNC